MHKYSRQREAVKRFLSDRKDHPTAEQVYEALRLDIPDISLGTVYRNLAALTEAGEIRKVVCENDEKSHFDPDTSPHLHFCCTRCHGLSDVSAVSVSGLIEQVGPQIPGEVERIEMILYGICSDCLIKE